MICELLSLLVRSERWTQRPLHSRTTPYFKQRHQYTTMFSSVSVDWESRKTGRAVCTDRGVGLPSLRCPTDRHVAATTARPAHSPRGHSNPTGTMWPERWLTPLNASQWTHSQPHHSAVPFHGLCGWRGGGGGGEGVTSVTPRAAHMEAKWPVPSFRTGAAGRSDWSLYWNKVPTGTD